MKDGQQLPIDEAFDTAFQVAYEEMAGRGQRVIACAALKLSSADFPEGYEFATDNFPEDSLVFCGLVGLQDPPKPGKYEFFSLFAIANKVMSAY